MAKNLYKKRQALRLRYPAGFKPSGGKEKAGTLEQTKLRSVVSARENNQAYYGGVISRSERIFNQLENAICMFVPKELQAPLTYSSLEPRFILSHTVDQDELERLGAYSYVDKYGITMDVINDHITYDNLREVGIGEANISKLQVITEDLCGSMWPKQTQIIEVEELGPKSQEKRDSCLRKISELGLDEKLYEILSIALEGATSEDEIDKLFTRASNASLALDCNLLDKEV